MILANIYCALTVFQKGKRFFEGCNIFIQLLIDQSDYITSHAKRVEKFRCLEGVNDLVERIRGVQRYVPLWVLRQLGRCQILPIMEDIKDFVSDVGLEVPLLEGLTQKIWDSFIAGLLE
ncbi:hypothetical protein H5410_027360 [Solanum commersonii]|uniref:Uncharacterized protein n=1 Tax=Solanum commersonii TaxID=4109 RepID=A0A9J5Z360_SOLCO|nr:hypothetical protein H5410_027360 [Solanum commersonii]